MSLIIFCATNAYRREKGHPCWFCERPSPCECELELRKQVTDQIRNACGGVVMTEKVIAMGHALTLAPKCAKQEIRTKSGNGQGELVRALSGTVFAQAELYGAKPKGVDAVHLSRLENTDYCRWVGRRSDGRFHQIGRLMQIVRVL
jgi:hypothetical protein